MWLERVPRAGEGANEDFEMELRSSKKNTRVHSERANKESEIKGLCRNESGKVGRENE